MAGFCGVGGVGAVSKVAPPANAKAVGEGGVGIGEPPLMQRVGPIRKLRDMCAVTTMWANDPSPGVKVLRIRRVRMGPPTNFPSALAVKLSWSQSKPSST